MIVSIYPLTIAGCNELREYPHTDDLLFEIILHTLLSLWYNENATNHHNKSCPTFGWQDARCMSGFVKNRNRKVSIFCLVGNMPHQMKRHIHLIFHKGPYSQHDTLESIIHQQMPMLAILGHSMSLLYLLRN